MSKKNTKKQEKNSSRFNIDFFEFSFLVEACIPPRPIARAVFWDDVINKHYHVLTEEERKNLLDWISRNPCFDLNNEDCALFEARFNPDNQYNAKTLCEGKEETIECFKFKERLQTAKNVFINEDYIIDVYKKNK